MRKMSTLLVLAIALVVAAAPALATHEGFGTDEPGEDTVGDDEVFDNERNDEFFNTDFDTRDGRIVLVEDDLNDGFFSIGLDEFTHDNDGNLVFSNDRVSTQRQGPTDDRFVQTSTRRTSTQSQEMVSLSGDDIEQRFDGVVILSDENVDLEEETIFVDVDALGVDTQFERTSASRDGTVDSEFDSRILVIDLTRTEDSRTQTVSTQRDQQQVDDDRFQTTSAPRATDTGVDSQQQNQQPTFDRTGSGGGGQGGGGLY